MTPEASGPPGTPKTPEASKNPEALSHVNTAAEWLSLQGVRTPQHRSPISASTSSTLTARPDSTNEEGTDVGAAREEPIVLAQPEGAVERGAAAAEEIMPPSALPAPAVDTKVPPIR